jgi:hypothetical protein
MKKTTPQEQTPQQEKQEEVKVDTEPTVSEDAEWAAKIVEKAKAQLAALEKRQAPELEA